MQTAQPDSLLTKQVAQAEGLEAKLTEAARLLEQTLREQGPEAYQTTLDIIWYQAVGGIAAGLLALLAAPALWFLAYKSIQWAEQCRDGVGWGVLGISSGLFGVFSGIVACVQLLNWWSWVALTDPKIVLAKRVLEQTGLLN